MRLRLLVAPVVLFITQLVNATPSPKPVSCPTDLAIKKIGVSAIAQDRADTWMAVELKNNYGTSDEWTFMITAFKGNTPEEILKKANEALTKLYFTDGPIQNGQKWFCTYLTGSDPFIVGMAVTPAGWNL